MYKEYNINQIVLPLDLTVKLDPKDIAFAVSELVESIPNDCFRGFEHEQGASSYPPRMMLKLILCAYTQRTFSGRKIEALVKDSLRMMWLAQGHQPSYRTINRFRVHPLVQPLLEECFIQFRSRLVAEKEIDEDAIFIDGTKIEANANKYTFVWRKSIENYEKKLDEKSQALYQELLKNEVIPALKEENSENWQDADFDRLIHGYETLDQAFTEQIQQAPSKEAAAPSRTLRKNARQKKKWLSEAQKRKTRYHQQKKILGTRNSYSKTDEDATFMRMKEDPMKNGQLKAGYNLQIGTNKQYILGYQLFPNPTDTRTFAPFLQTLDQHFGFLPDTIVADAGYGGEENYETVLDEWEKTPLIPYGMYEKEQKKKVRQDPFRPGNWFYDELQDAYRCPNERWLTFKKYQNRKDKYGYERHFKIYQCEDCRSCPVRSQCTRAKGDRPRQIQKNMNWEYFKHFIQERLEEETQKKIYQQRKVDVEPAFANLKANLGFTRCSVRGHEKVTQELGFALLAVNLNKYTAREREKQRDERQKRQKEAGKKIFSFSLLLLKRKSSFQACFA